MGCNIVTKETHDYQEYNGIVFHRLKNRPDRYFGNKNVGIMHRYIWENKMGPIPKDCVIHHVDQDKGNNDLQSNLVMMTKSEHRRWHATHMSAKQRIKIGKSVSKTNKGHKVTEETRRKISESLKGRKASEETKIIMSINRKGRKVWNKGLKTGPRSEETKERISKGMKKAAVERYKEEMDAIPEGMNALETE